VLRSGDFAILLLLVYIPSISCEFYDLGARSRFLPFRKVPDDTKTCYRRRLRRHRPGNSVAMNGPVEPEMNAEIVWHEIRKTYPDGHEAVRGVSLTVDKGEVLALLGTSGSGKTTLLKMVNRLIDPTSGEVLVGGKQTTQWDPISLRRSIGYVIQDVGLMPHMSVLSNVGLVPRLLGIPRSARDARAEELLNLVGLDPKQTWPPDASGAEWRPAPARRRGPRSGGRPGDHPSWTNRSAHSIP